MKRSIGTAVVLGIASALMAQAPFTIVSPRNYNPDTNSPMSRENVVIKFPKASIVPNSYVGIFLGKTRGDQVIEEKFMEAVVPSIEGDYAVYRLNTKGRKLADDMYTLRAVLYVDYSDRPREINQSQVNIRIANQSSIKVPDDGLKLRYGYARGREWIYNLEVRTALSTISAGQNAMGGRAAELPLEAENIRLLYAIDATYPNGDGLMRMQVMPERGKNYAWVRIDGDQQAQKYYSYEMAPVYMRVSSTGMEVFGAIPDAVSSKDIGTLTTGGSKLELYANLPLPTLPTKAVRPSDSWQSRFLMSNLDLAKRFEMQSFTSKIPARGEFVGVEYEGGHPCALIRNTIVQGTRTKEGIRLRNNNRDFGDDKVSLDETIWFALDTRDVIKIVRDITIDTKDPSGLGVSTNQGGGQPRAPQGDQGAGGAGIAQPGTMGGGRAGGNWAAPPRPGGPATGAPPTRNGSGAPPQQNGGFGGNQRGGNQTGTTAQYVRIRQQMIWTLER